MLVQQDWQDANRKRSREDEYQDIAAGGTLGFTEHRSVGCYQEHGKRLTVGNR
jgi:hypothetical protein